MERHEKRIFLVSANRVKWIKYDPERLWDHVQGVLSTTWHPGRNVHFLQQGTTCTTEISLAVSQRARLSAPPALDNRRGHLFWFLTFIYNIGDILDNSVLYKGNFGKIGEKMPKTTPKSPFL